MVPGVVSIDKMQIGRKCGGKHWTKAEIERRHQAAQTLLRQKPKLPKAPDWIKADLELYAIWRQILKDAKDVDLFDALDANTLATYCKLELEKRRAAAQGDVDTFTYLAKVTLQYAKSLGLTPEARARLVKKRADGEGGDPNADLFE